MTNRHNVSGLNVGPKPLAKSLSANLETHSTSVKTVSYGNGSGGKDVARSECPLVTRGIGAYAPIRKDADVSQVRTGWRYPNVNEP